MITSCVQKQTSTYHVLTVICVSSLVAWFTFAAVRRHVWTHLRYRNQYIALKRCQGTIKYILKGKPAFLA
ncbi:hypothetical protein DAEQUDRAFT_180965 [Daedalea quercina L-15889]|uniref:Uncharacterized protein n=1 Tax=Daedalea quercina L-15889 TaxID=1314783 RepID=A0A165REL1_9APHY|nr:hypothetical protein DAEQUDRAFT_180965 [Daedalea quercina L-15889]